MIRDHHLIQLGAGNVGGALVSQIRSSKERLAGESINLVYCGLFTSRLGVFDPNGLSPEQIANFPAEGQIADQTRAVESVSLPFTVIDTTSSDATLPILKLALSRGGSIVLANKKPLAGSQADYDELIKIGAGRIFYEATVGAGLPIISTLENLIATGDAIMGVKGCFSGTLGYILSQLNSTHTYSATVRQALRLGFTEPDPRDDLSGMDVARKAIILSRLMGRRMEPVDLEPEALFPARFASLTIPEFMKRLPELDDGISRRIDKAQKRNFTLRYVAQVSPTETSVGLQEVNLASDIGALSGPDNMVIIRSGRYSKNPIVIKGPGAGPDVTAAGVFADILQAARLRDANITTIGAV